MSAAWLPCLDAVMIVLVKRGTWRAAASSILRSVDIDDKQYMTEKRKPACGRSAAARSFTTPQKHIAHRTDSERQQVRWSQDSKDRPVQYMDAIANSLRYTEMGVVNRGVDMALIAEIIQRFAVYNKQSSQRYALYRSP